MEGFNGTKEQQIIIIKEADKENIVIISPKHCCKMVNHHLNYNKTYKNLIAPPAMS